MLCHFHNSIWLLSSYSTHSSSDLCSLWDVNRSIVYSQCNREGWHRAQIVWIQPIRNSLRLPVTWARQRPDLGTHAKVAIWRYSWTHYCSCLTFRFYLTSVKYSDHIANECSYVACNWWIHSATTWQCSNTTKEDSSDCSTFQYYGRNPSIQQCLQFKVNHTNSTFCRLCIIYKIPELIKVNYFPEISFEKMYTHSYAGFSKYAKTYTIRKYKATCTIWNCYVCKKNHQYSWLSNLLLESSEPHASSVYIGSFSVVHPVLWNC